MFASREVRHPVADARRRGLPALGLAFSAPAALTWTPCTDGALLGRGIERGADGAVVGELELALIPAALIMDRDGVLAALAQRAADRLDAALDAIGPCTWPGLAGTVATLVRRDRAALPYLTIHVVTGDSVVAGAVELIARHAAHSWPVLDDVVASLRVAAKDAQLARR